MLLLPAGGRGREVVASYTRTACGLAVEVAVDQEACGRNRGVAGRKLVIGFGNN
jgi:hypothetical protein